MYLNKDSIVSLNLLVAKARKLLTSWKLLKEAKFTFDQDKDFCIKLAVDLIESGVKTVSQDYL